MSTIKPGGVRAGLDFVHSRLFRFQDAGLIPTDGIQWSSIATFGTTAVNILQETIDPGYTMKLHEVEVGLSQRFTGLNGSFVASTTYYWTAQPKGYRIPSGGAPIQVDGQTVNITGTYTKGVGTLVTSDDTFSGFIPAGSLPYAPFELTLKAVGIQAAVCQGKVKNSSYIRLVGAVIPGT